LGNNQCNFNYTGSPLEKMMQKVLGGGATFWLTLYVEGYQAY